jgi:hypothetical protein
MASLQQTKVFIILHGIDHQKLSVPHYINYAMKTLFLQKILNLLYLFLSYQRQHYWDNRLACFQQPKRFLSIILDGMDHQKLSVPHYVNWRKPKVTIRNIILSIMLNIYINACVLILTYLLTYHIVILTSLLYIYIYFYISDL